MKNKMIPLHLKSDRNWEEDLKDENGMNTNQCSTCTLEFVGHKYRRMCKDCTNKNKVPNFDFEFFKNYIDTYDPEKDGGNMPDIIFLDILYGMGLSVDEVYKNLKGFKYFKGFLGERFKNDTENN